MTFAEIDAAYCRQLGIDPARVPAFEPSNGNESARILAILERPGPMTLKPRGSGLISQRNDDDTARNLKAQLADAGIAAADFCLTNIVAHVVTDDGKVASNQVKVHEYPAGAQRLEQIMAAMPNLEYIFLMGKKATTGFCDYVEQIPSGVQVIDIWHTSRQGTGDGKNTKSRYYPRYMENVRALSSAA